MPDIAIIIGLFGLAEILKALASPPLMLEAKPVGRIIPPFSMLKKHWGVTLRSGFIGLIIGALPFVMAVLMYLASRDYMMLLVTEPLGRLMMGAGVASMAVGGFVMRKMTRFEI